MAITGGSSNSPSKTATPFPSASACVQAPRIRSARRTRSGERREGRVDDGNLRRVDDLLPGEAHPRRLRGLGLESVVVLDVEVDGVHRVHARRPGGQDELAAGMMDGALVRRSRSEPQVQRQVHVAEDQTGHAFAWRWQWRTRSGPPGRSRSWRRA